MKYSLKDAAIDVARTIEGKTMFVAFIIGTALVALSETTRNVFFLTAGASILISGTIGYPTAMRSILSRKDERKRHEKMMNVLQEHREEMKEQNGKMLKRLDDITGILKSVADSLDTNTKALTGMADSLDKNTKTLTGMADSLDTNTKTLTGVVDSLDTNTKALTGITNSNNRKRI